IVFEGSRAELCTRIELEEGARFIGWETSCLGRPAANEGFTAGYYRQRFEIWRVGVPVLIERSLFAGGGEMLQAAWGLRGFNVSATLIALPADEQVLALVRAAVRTVEPDLFAASLINGTLVCRYLGRETEDARRAFIAAWRVIRPRLTGHAMCEPRIWMT
ncbi:MAG TPA: urease accessory protein UreD, partial [Gammaproteobacteria bacterium]